MTSPNLIVVASEAARAAGREIVELLQHKRDVRSKGWRDLVTDGDLASQDILVGIIRDRFPDHAILSEELPPPTAPATITWVLDPIDGTSNYARGFPTFAVSVGVVDGDGLLCGAVYDPLLDHLFTAERGGGARLNGEPLSVSTVVATADAIVGLDFARAPEARAELMRRVNQYAPHIHTFRTIGSAALGLCYVAKGWLEAYFHATLAPWDSAAGALVVREAGGIVTDLDGAPWAYGHPRCLASNGLVHDALIQMGRAGSAA